MTPADVRDRLLDLLYQHNMKPRDLAIALLPTRATSAQKRNKLRLVRRWISPSNPTAPNRDHARRIADYFGVDPGELTLTQARDGAGPSLASLEQQLVEGLQDLREQLTALQDHVRTLEARRARRAPRKGRPS